MVDTGAVAAADIIVAFPDACFVAVVVIVVAIIAVVTVCYFYCCYFIAGIFIAVVMVYVVTEGISPSISLPLLLTEGLAIACIAIRNS